MVSPFLLRHREAFSSRSVTLRSGFPRGKPQSEKRARGHGQRSIRRSSAGFQSQQGAGRPSQTCGGHLACTADSRTLTTARRFDRSGRTRAASRAASLRLFQRAFCRWRGDPRSPGRDALPSVPRPFSGRSADHRVSLPQPRRRSSAPRHSSSSCDPRRDG